MSYLEERLALTDKIMRILYTRDFKTLVSERSWVETLLKDYETYKDQLPPEITKDKLEIITDAYKWAVTARERELMRQTWYRK